MRDIALLLFFVWFLVVACRFPFGGLLVWAWLSLMNPHRLVYGFANGQPFNLAIAVVTLIAWALSREPKRLPPDATPWLMVLISLWMTFNSVFAPFPDWSWPFWSLAIKDFIFALVALALLTGKARLHTMVWVLVLSVGFYGVKGGVFTLLSGGSSRVYGPESTPLADNNALAVAIVMILPLVLYLRRTTAHRWLRRGLLFSLPLLIITVLGSYSRGGVIAMAAVVAALWARSRGKALTFVLGAILGAFALSVMPDAFWERMGTIKDAASDESFMGRVLSWKVCVLYAIDHFPFGAGAAGTQLPDIFYTYVTGIAARAAHSIYFQVLGEYGFVGLALYLALAASALRNGAVVIRQTRDRNGFAWAAELARMAQLSLIGFFVGGALLSLAYFDLYLALVAVLSALRELTKAKSPRAVAAGGAGAGISRAAACLRPVRGASARVSSAAGAGRYCG